MWLGQGWIIDVIIDVAGGRNGPWKWLEVGMYPGCGWGLGWMDGPWMWLGVGVDPGCG